MPDMLGFFLFGALGALARDLVQDNSIQLPALQGGILSLGFVGSMIVGAFVGYAVDHSFITAALSGYVGISAIRNLLPPLPPSQKKE